MSALILPCVNPALVGCAVTFVNPSLPLFTKYPIWANGEPFYKNAINYFIT
jgi:hypothetical protein